MGEELAWIEKLDTEEDFLKIMYQLEDGNMHRENSMLIKVFKLKFNKIPNWGHLDYDEVYK